MQHKFIRWNTMITSTFILKKLQRRMTIDIQQYSAFSFLSMVVLVLYPDSDVSYR